MHSQTARTALTLGLDMSEFILVLAILTTESSYKSELERPATLVTDTSQFWFGLESTWRIRTYAIDHDIHIYSLGKRNDGSSFLPTEAEIHLKKIYGDILQDIFVIKFGDPNNTVEVEKVLDYYDLKGSLEVSENGVAFYNPDRVKYKTQTQPK